MLNAHRSLLEFLTSAQIACQTDNVAVRMLLWPHPLIPDDDFTREENDEVLIELALASLEAFSRHWMSWRIEICRRG